MSNSSPSLSSEMIIQGVPASPGLVVGKAFRYHHQVPVVESVRVDEDMIPVQLEIFKNARQTLQERWRQLLEKEDNEESKAILSAQLQIIADPELSAQIELYIEDERYGAQQAIDKAFRNYIQLLSDSGNDRLRDRMIDLTDIRDRLVEAAGASHLPMETSEGDVLVAREVSPREVIQLSHRNVRGIIMEKGGHTSHAAIIARSMAIPAVVGAKGATRHLGEETTVCVNGESGLVIFNPSNETRKHVQSVNAGKSDSLEEKIEICRQPSETTDGHPFTIRANIEFPEELQHAVQFRAEGIGLLRTESIYLDREEFGSQQKQASQYEEVVARIKHHPVTIRLFDVGGDKLQGAEVSENNPFLGWRGIRMLLDERDILKDQLKAILTVADKYPGRVKVLIPMVSTIDEIRQVKHEIVRCREELADAGRPVSGDNMAVGIMVEIPSTAIQAAHFAEEVDFFSIGTNDLTQYLLAVDRGNALISRHYDQQHPALWKVINHIAQAARDHDIEVELCGELGSYPVAAACLLGMGVSQLSMSPVNIPQVKKILIQNSFDDMEHLAEQVLLSEEVDDIRSLFSNWKNNIIHE